MQIIFLKGEKYIMSKIAITVDSSCDVPNGVFEQNDIKVFAITNILGDEVYKDGVDISASELLAKSTELGVLPKTSAVSSAEYEEGFEEVLKNYDELIHLSISSKASCSYQNAQLASEKFNGKVSVVDTKLLSGGIGLVLNKALKMREDGLSFKEMINGINELLDKTILSFVVDTMDFLYKGGRCSSMQYVGAKILKIHPEIVMVDGQLKSGAKYIGKVTKCYEKYIEELAAKYPDYDDSVCYITYSPTSEEYISVVDQKVKECFNFKEIKHVNASGTITCHCGPNTVGVLFITK